MPRGPGSTITTATKLDETTVTRLLASLTQSQPRDKNRRMMQL